MAFKRSILIDGLGKTLRRLPALLWTYAFSLLIAFAFSYPLKKDLAAMLDHSLAAQSMTSGFDLDAMIAGALRLHDQGGAAQARNAGSVAVLAYLVMYFLMVPGTLFCYTTRAKARLSTLLGRGVSYFWRFVRIALLSSLIFALALLPLMILQSRWSEFVDGRFVGTESRVLRFAGLLLVLLIASLIRLYFDLVEAYTVQMGSDPRTDGREDSRIRRTLRPAFRLLRGQLLRAWLVFLVIAIGGAAASLLISRVAVHMLAKPAAWPMFFTAQAGILMTLFARFWQRGAEVSLAAQYPLPFARQSTRIPFTRHSSSPTWDHPQHVGMVYNNDPLAPIYPAPLSSEDRLAASPIVAQETLATTTDPIPDPEPAAPSLDEPDPGVYHHEPGKH